MIRPRREDGFVMVVIVVVIALVGTLGAVAMTNGNHASTASGRGRAWEQALHVAEAGGDVAMARIQQLNGSYTSPLTITGTTNEGSYSVTVTALPRKRHLVHATGKISGPVGLRAKRLVSFVLAPPEVFEAALFSDTSIDTKNNDHVVGDIWANENVRVDADDLIEGSVKAATGWIWLYNRSRVTGSVHSGGYNAGTTDAIRLEELARVDGNATGSVSAPSGAGCSSEPQSKYTIRLLSNAAIGGSAKTWGNITNQGSIGGATYPNTCTAAPATDPIPQFVYNPANYDSATLHVWGTPDAPSPTAANDAQLWINANRSNMVGTVVAFQSGGITQASRLDLSGAIIKEDFNVITNLPIYSAVASDEVPDNDAIMLLASFYQPEAGTQCDVNNDNSECSIHLKNGVALSQDVAVMAYAPYGPVAIKNNAESFGAIYSQNIQIKNNQNITYDARIKRMIGFGPVTLEPTEWRELKPS